MKRAAIVSSVRDRYRWPTGSSACMMAAAKPGKTANTSQHVTAGPLVVRFLGSPASGPRSAWPADYPVPSRQTLHDPRKR